MHAVLRSFAIALLLAGPGLASAQGVGVLYDAEGVMVGQYVQRGSPTAARTVVHSLRGFRFAILDETATLADVEFDVGGASFGVSLLYGNPQCTGQAWVSAGGSVGSSVAGGIVIPAGPEAFYVPKGPEVTVTAVSGVRLNSACTPIAPANYAVVPAYPNDPTVTGVPDLPFIPPLRLEVVPLSQFRTIFRDGFDLGRWLHASDFGDQSALPA